MMLLSFIIKTIRLILFESKLIMALILLGRHNVLLAITLWIIFQPVFILRF